MFPQLQKSVLTTIKHEVRDLNLSVDPRVIERVTLNKFKGLVTLATTSKTFGGFFNKAIGPLEKELTIPDVECGGHKW
jgi:hypothetical protein